MKSLHNTHNVIASPPECFGGRSNLKLPVITKRLPRRSAPRNDLGSIFKALVIKFENTCLWRNTRVEVCLLQESREKKVGDVGKSGTWLTMLA